MPDVQKASGEENLRADAKVYDATASGSEKASPGGKGKDAGGDTTNATTLASPGKTVPKGSESRRAGVQTYTEDAT